MSHKRSLHIFCHELILRFSLRLYKEIPPVKDDKSDDKKKKKEKEKKKKKKDKKEKRKKKKHRNSVDSDDDADNRSKWSVACLTLQDWEELTEKYKKSKKKCDRELYETLNDSFMPEIVKMFAEKEKEERRRQLMMQPKRASSRIERKKQEQEERDRLLAIKVRSPSQKRKLHFACKAVYEYVFRDCCKNVIYDCLVRWSPVHINQESVKIRNDGPGLNCFTSFLAGGRTSLGGGI